MSNCYKEQAGRLLATLKEPEDKSKMHAYGYVKRSLELMAKGAAGAIDLDTKTGQVIGAGSLITRKGVNRINTMGSLGGWDDVSKTTSGMRVLGKLYEQSIGKKLVVYAENPQAAALYMKAGGKGTKDDFNDMTVPKEHIEGYATYIAGQLKKRKK